MEEDGGRRCRRRLVSHTRASSSGFTRFAARYRRWQRRPRRLGTDLAPLWGIRLSRVKNRDGIPVTSAGCSATRGITTFGETETLCPQPRLVALNEIEARPGERVVRGCPSNHAGRPLPGLLSFFGIRRTAQRQGHRIVPHRCDASLCCRLWENSIGTEPGRSCPCETPESRLTEGHECPSYEGIGAPPQEFSD